MGKQAGRPRSGIYKRDRKILLSANNMEYRILQAKAEKSGLTVSEYCRDAALHGKVAQTLSKEAVYMIKELYKIGINLNQVAHRMNADGHFSYIADVLRLSSELKAVIKTIQK